MFGEMYVRAYCVRLLYVVYIKVDVPRRSLKKKMRFITQLSQAHREYLRIIMLSYILSGPGKKQCGRTLDLFKIRSEGLCITLPISSEKRQICKSYLLFK